MIRVMRGSSPRQKLNTPPSLYIVDAVDVQVRYSGLLYMWACAHTQGFGMRRGRKAMSGSAPRLWFQRLAGPYHCWMGV
jgi:hypothetical protein